LISRKDISELNHINYYAKKDSMDLYEETMKKRLAEKNYPKSVVILHISGIDTDSILIMI